MTAAKARTAIGVGSNDNDAARVTAAALATGAPTRTTLFGAIVYIRWAPTIHALRQTVGNPTFFAILRAYLARFQNSAASTSDFIALASKQSHQNLEPLLHSWLYDRALPPLTGNDP